MSPKSVPSRSRGILRPGARVTVVGGGPSGSFFALYALHYARRMGLGLRVTIFEPRDFERPGPNGCNMCAGLIPSHVTRDLREIDLDIPERVIRARIRHYTLHTAAGTIRIPQPDADGDVISVSRGVGPPAIHCRSTGTSFDGFLLDEARARGAEVIREPVTRISLLPRPTVMTALRTFSSDLVVLATGINAPPVQFDGLAYRPPQYRRMAQIELCPGEDAARAGLGDSVHVFLPHGGRFTFGTLIPKGPCVTASLLSQDQPAAKLKSLLASRQAAALLPACTACVCGCVPRVAVGAAQPLCADRFVVVGDAGITRLYKDGIGTALRTSRQAANAAVRHGCGGRDFRDHYLPLCREIKRDNWAGRLLFGFTRILQRHDRLTRLHVRSVADEQALPPENRLHTRLLWGMSTGTYSYRRLLRMACHPRLHLRMLPGGRAWVHGRRASRESHTPSSKA
jgi:flavin-dependent dehydrogenase